MVCLQFCIKIFVYGAGHCGLVAFVLLLSWYVILLDVGVEVYYFDCNGYALEMFVLVAFCEVLCACNLCGGSLGSVLF